MNHECPTHRLRMPVDKKTGSFRIVELSITSARILECLLRAGWIVVEVLT